MEARAIYKWGRRAVQGEVLLRLETNIGHGQISIVTEQILCNRLVIYIHLQNMCTIHTSNKYTEIKSCSKIPSVV